MKKEKGIPFTKVLAKTVEWTLQTLASLRDRIIVYCSFQQLIVLSTKGAQLKISHRRDFFQILKDQDMHSYKYLIRS